ncbi:MAG: F0F1 ATP synthase subunit delta [bacterium]
MSELTTAARPYAKAVYELATAEGTEKSWSDALELLKSIVGNDSVANLLDSPKVTKEQLAELLIEVGGEGFDQKAKNLVKLLAENSRLEVVPELADMYEQLVSEAHGSIEATVVSAQALDDSQQQTLAKSLSHRLGRDVKLECSVDESLLGGVVVHAGDLVIDGSLKGRLEKLTSALTR